jgi:hypothetical protein
VVLSVGYELFNIWLDDGTPAEVAVQVEQPVTAPV